ncbi:hypothetical protein J3R30DRAFT_3709597 [Lentinula aciculospora]|uniref:BOD1/SHG1 domain-containing protein n=1 Tax=Lentinula aciculospora TaxID=153920 RepID=A0A9W9A3I7_9AGAR|nr:hypothetical protein J3R30DRAFT_3709597 [Lentinula aciculospora]
MPATNPNQLVEEQSYVFRFKKSGEFDRLRRELFAEFQKGDHISSFNKKTEDVVQQRFASMKSRSFISARFNKNESNLRTELLQEIQRYPYVETTVNDMPIFSDKTFDNSLKDCVMRILKEEPNENERNWDLKEKGVDVKHSDSSKDSQHPDSKREEFDIIDESTDLGDGDKIEDNVRIKETRSTFVNGKHKPTVISPSPPSTRVSQNNPKELDITSNVEESLVPPPSLTRRSPSNLSSLSSVSSRSPSLPAESHADHKLTATSVSVISSLPEPVSDVVRGGSSHIAQNRDTSTQLERSISSTSQLADEGNADVAMQNTNNQAV